MEIFSGFDYEQYINQLKRRNKTVPSVVKEALADTANFTDSNERVKFLLHKLQSSKSYKPSTVDAYVRLFKSLIGLKPNEGVQINKLAFEPSQSRYVPIEELEAMRDYFIETNDLLMQFCFVTGLRSMEVAQFASNHLDDLTKRASSTTIILKGGKKQWVILWTPDLVELVEKLVDCFSQELNFYRETNAIIVLWNLQPLSISVRFKQAYVVVMRRLPPKGFGLHNIRYYWATKYANNLVQAKLKLNHTSIHTTQSYVKMDAQKINFDALNNSAFYQAIFKN